MEVAEREKLADRIVDHVLGRIEDVLNGSKILKVVKTYEDDIGKPCTRENAVKEEYTVELHINGE